MNLIEKVQYDVDFDLIQIKFKDITKQNDNFEEYFKDLCIPVPVQNIPR